MLYSPKLYLKDRWVLAPLIVSIAAQFVMWWYIVSKLSGRADQVFLHYNVVFGVDLVGKWWQALFLPLGGVIILVVNFLASFLFYRADKFLAHFLTIITMGLEVFLTIATIIVVGMNI